MSFFYRIHDERRDHAGILDPANWASESYGHELWVTDPETGEEVEDVRYGVSACASIAELAAYVAQTGVEVTRPVLIEVEADLAVDADHDADLGAVLTFPRSITRIITDTHPEWADFDAALTDALGF